ncbi:4-hydroxy-tetrahydrodipicolinate reductase [Magnetospira sp. QH-2]|uniref:4-hydroxy-tetrahydrodipicolinate reductase n=1 Tax=Magnetospira sp. (strain QH-2) TaxID=1288970 RepID=UPI0003E81760|nr:4-hydroxy-tetrahydrodipicolinate reductase [Magnetospira sp. QH-2]CCQ75679.1 Dihydrodipicolinate reductase (DHPR) [Magnetospira sp. QH-2]
MKIGIVGCAGRMGRMLVQTVLSTEGAEFGGGSETASSPMIGKDCCELAGLMPSGQLVTDNPRELFERVDVVIDFTIPAATAEHARIAADLHTALIIGTTGLDSAQQGLIEAAAAQAPVVQAPNFSLGVNLLMALTEKVAATLNEDYDIEIVEMHHRHKVDAPSGTALGLGLAAAKGRGVDLDTVAQKVRDGHTGARKKGDIGFATLRGGDVVGDHTAMFAGEMESVMLTHQARSRAVFARGAVHAALWTGGKAAGLYSMQDVLNLD